ncbi:hypothetical protein SAMN02745146_3101 [Hymenobacter daecheongensis DSM 21074]|uniref:Uncharacterized protein n=1 Tax=Hymenobacter daecheongensis DSM 21074 TaxID=1121955 RepID=A0A1M6J598_9BACT|nr:hypothetical protein [Hymenobacter daecheongensis]SHJ41801.1 hypothetical protein SAMN02745146_3101 [Hymenobacter daecheongensis DSM 21074]
MTFFAFRSVRGVLAGLLLGGVLAGACRPYRIPNPTGPPQPKVVKAKKPDAESADGRSAPITTEAKPIRNSYDKHGLMKKPKYERRRLKHKVGQRRFLGIPLPF